MYPSVAYRVWREEIIALVFKNINSFITKGHNHCVCMWDRGLLWLTQYLPNPCWDTHIQGSASSCFFDGRLIQGWFSALGPLVPLADMLTSIDWPPQLTAWVENFLHYLFSGYPHIFPSVQCNHVIHFHCLLFNLWHRCNILFMNNTLTGCQRSICNTSKLCSGNLGFVPWFSVVALVWFIYFIFSFRLLFLFNIRCSALFHWSSG